MDDDFTVGVCFTDFIFYFIEDSVRLNQSGGWVEFQMKLNKIHGAAGPCPQIVETTNLRVGCSDRVYLFPVFLGEFSVEQHIW